MCSQPNEKNGFSMRVPKLISAKGRYDFAESRYGPTKAFGNDGHKKDFTGLSMLSAFFCLTSMRQNIINYLYEFARL